MFQRTFVTLHPLAPTPLWLLAAAGLMSLSYSRADAATTPVATSQALIAQDYVALRASPRDSATQQAQLWQGELVEVRGERMDYVQIWDYKRERGGYVRANQIRRVSFTAADADAMLPVLRFIKDLTGSEGLTVGYGAAWLKAATATQINSSLGSEVLDAMGGAAERLARRASTAGMSKSMQETVAAQLDAAQRYGIRFNSYELEGKINLCYDGELFARVLAMPASSQEQRSRAALALTRSDCEDPALALKNPAEYKKLQELRASLLDKADTQGLNPYLKNRLHLRRAGVWSALAYAHARSGQGSSAQAAQRAIDEMAGVDKAELPDEDQVILNDAVMRVNASRWAALNAMIAVTNVPSASGFYIATSASSQAGETCVKLMKGKALLATRCTYGLVWSASFSVNHEANAASLAVQTQVGWREMWVFRAPVGQASSDWSVEVLPPAAVSPELGYIELAGWVPGGQQMLVARESRGDGKYKRSYEVLELATLSTQRQASDPSLLGAFQRWPQPLWKQHTLSLR